MTGDAILTLRGVRKSFGNLVVLDGVDLDLQAGHRQAVIGPNGSGKSTLLMTIAGALRASAGSIRLDDREIGRWSVSRRARHGLAVKFQAPRVFPSLTVLDNIRLAGRGGTALSRQLLSREPAGLTRRVADVMAVTRLDAYRDQRAAMLSHGHQQWLELAMALVNLPRVVLLDEPTAGMSVQERAATAEILTALGTDVSVLLIEHDFDFVRTVCDVVTVLDQGTVLASGTPQAISQDEAVRAAYTDRLAAS